MLEEELKRYHDDLVAAENYLLVTLPDLPENIIAEDAENIISIIYKHRSASDLLKILTRNKNLKELFANVILKNISEKSKNLILSSIELSSFCAKVLAEARADALINFIYEHREEPGFLAALKQNRSLMDLLAKSTLNNISADASNLILNSVSLNIFFAEILTEKHGILYKIISKKRIPALITETRSIFNAEKAVISYCQLYYSYFNKENNRKDFIEVLGEESYQQLLVSLQFIMQCKIPGDLRDASQIKPDSLALFLEFWQSEEFITKINHILKVTRIYEKIKKEDMENEKQVLKEEKILAKLQGIIDSITGFEETVVNGKVRRRQSEHMVSNFFALLSRPLQSIHMCLKAIEGGFDKVIKLDRAISYFENINSAVENNLNDSNFDAPKVIGELNISFDTSYVSMLPNEQSNSSTPVKPLSSSQTNWSPSPISKSNSRGKIKVAQLRIDDDFFLASDIPAEEFDDKSSANLLSISHNTAAQLTGKLGRDSFYNNRSDSCRDLITMSEKIKEQEEQVKRNEEQIQFTLDCTNKLEEDRKKIEFVKSEISYVHKKLAKDNWRIDSAFKKLDRIDIGIDTSFSIVADAFSECKPKNSRSCFSFFNNLIHNHSSLTDTLYANFGSAENIERAYLARDTLKQIVDSWIKVKNTEWSITGSGGEYCHLTRNRRSYLLPKHAAEIVELYDKAESYDGISWEKALSKTWEILKPLYREQQTITDESKPSPTIIYINKPMLRSKFTQQKYNEALQHTNATLSSIQGKYPANKEVHKAGSEPPINEATVADPMKTYYMLTRQF